MSTAGDVTRSDSDNKPLFFISHRHEDKPLADALAKFLRTSSLGQVKVFQSSDAKAEGPKAGGYLTDQLAAVLWKAAVVVLIWTRSDADWAWCMLECGLALHPESPDTRVIVFTCDAALPPQFEGRVAVKIKDHADVQRFANGFLTDPKFLTGFGGPVAAGFHPNDDNVVDAAARLYESLNAIEIAAGKDLADEWPAAPFLRLQLEPEQLEQLAREGTSQERLQAALGVLQQATIQDADDEAGRIFGRRRPEVGTPFADLIKAWTDECPGATASWLDALAQQVSKGAEWAFPPLRWELMRSVDDEDNAVYAPTVNRIRRWPSKRMQFDVYFQKFTLMPDRKTVKVGIPQDLQTGPAGSE
jgi:hypothetical protein